MEELVDGDSEADVADEVDDDAGGVEADHADITEALPHFIVTPCSTFCAVCKSGCKFKLVDVLINIGLHVLIPADIFCCAMYFDHSFIN